jgi:hypothetical protein
MPPRRPRLPELPRRLSMDSVAEYVETTDIAKELRQLGVDYGRVMRSVGQSRPARFCDPSIEDE